ncbi:Fc receptor-like protein 5 isoform X3 [Epinephelus moara]|uniref:Fc receptor-like protein 5 isoform X3 n=1 Tax=Epinephelus moara TaxID=300413 RepID=UPI00214E3538|nr:Fc receptor-like protein 5 isoform X3 [Epinephelus moara]
MGHTLLCVLALFLLSTLLYGQDEGQNGEQDRHTEGPDVKEGLTGATVSYNGLPQYSNNSGDAVLESPASAVFKGDSVTMRCRQRNPSNDMDAAFFKDGSPLVIDTNHQSRGAEMTISSVSKSDEGTYTCEFGDRTESEAKELRVRARRRVVTLRADKTTIPVGGHVTLTCDVEGATGLENLWIRYTSDSSEKPVDIKNGYQYDISHGGKYTCQGLRREPDFFTSQSNAVIIQETVSNKATVTLQPNWLQIFSGEKMTLRCEIQGGGDTGWTYDWSTTSEYTPPTGKDYIISSAAGYHSGQYSCMGRRDSYSSTQWSDVITLTVLSYRPRARLSADNEDIPVGGSVTLTCSVSPSSSSGWKYFWYRGEKTSKPLTTQDYIFFSDGKIIVSQGGLYWCRGGRGDPVYYTGYSGSVRVNKIITNRPVVTLHPNWPEICFGEMITLTCEIKNKGDNEWEYEWKHRSNTLRKQSEYMIGYASTLDRGDYKCRGRVKGETSSTEWSDAFRLRVSSNKPQPVLTVSPLWLSPGASVTLNCSVEHPSAGWRFFWYKAVPKLSDNSYSYELIPGSINGTEQDSYIVDGQTHTEGYVCRAGRGDPVYYTHYIEPKCVWSGDSHSAASLTVSPDRIQHFSREPVSLSCEGNSTEWRVSRFSVDGYLGHCSSSSSYWGTMTGSRCNMNSHWQSGVYWCESETGQFSNAVSITIQYGDIILVSPVHPVTEGDSVTLGCKLRTEKVPYNVDFYKNDKLVQNVTGGELTISAVSKSDEGFYKCKGKDSPEGRQTWMSPESWMSVKSAPRHEQSPPFPVLLIVGPVCGVLLILLLLLFLYLYRKSKDSCFMRSQSSSRGPATDHMINQDETQLKEYAPPLHGDAVLYESIKGFEEPEHGESSDVTYSVVELKNIAKKGNKKEEPEESAVYSDVKIRSATDNNVMYAQVNSHSKAKKDKGKSRPAAADETVYSEVKPGKALDQ